MVLVTRYYFGDHIKWKPMTGHAQDLAQ